MRIAPPSHDDAPCAANVELPPRAGRLYYGVGQTLYSEKIASHTAVCGPDAGLMAVPRGGGADGLTEMRGCTADGVEELVAAYDAAPPLVQTVLARVGVFDEWVVAAYT